MNYKSGIIVIRYEKSEELFNNLLDSLKHEFKVYVYDNSSNRIDVGSDIYYFHDSSNPGIGVGLNHCLKRANEDGVYICTYFDQDSDINLRLVNQLQESYRELKSKEYNLYILGPQPIISIEEEYPFTFISRKSDSLYIAKEIITSGMTFDVRNLLEIGGFKEDFYLDLVDFEICRRVNQNNKMIIVDKNIKMLHSVGEYTLNFFAFKLPVSKPWRNYYQTRNAVWLILNKENGLLKKILKLIRRSINILFMFIFADYKLLRLRYNILGFYDALKGNLGKCERI